MQASFTEWIQQEQPLLELSMKENKLLPKQNTRCFILLGNTSAWSLCMLWLLQFQIPKTKAQPIDWASDWASDTSGEGADDLQEWSRWIRPKVHLPILFSILWSSWDKNG